MARTFCNFCGAILDTGREFSFQMDMQDYCDDEAWLEFLENTPTYHGEPLRLCQACHASVLANYQAHADELAEIERSNRWMWRIFAVGAAALLAVFALYALRGSLP